MSTVQGGQGNIVTNGLVLNLDAANPRSYPQPYNGTTWQNIVTTNNSVSGSLINGVAYTGSNGGTLVFDGVDDYVDCGSNSTTKPTGSMTISYWFKGISATVGNFATGVGTMGFSGQRGYLLGVNPGTQISFFIPISSANLASVAYDFTVNPQIWYHISGVYSASNYVKMFLNGVEVASTTTSIPASQYTGNGISLKVGLRGDTYNFIGNISQVLFYHRALNPSEVLQNFNATRARFGI
jgi:hypothetical protein